MRGTALAALDAIDQGGKDVLRMMSALTVVAVLSGSQPPPAQQTPQQPVQAPTIQAPQTPPAPQPPVTRPPAEQIPAPTPTPTTPNATTPAVPSPTGDGSTALALLDRIGQIIDDALAERPSSKSGAVATSGSLEGKAGKVTVDRAALDELRAEVSMLKAMLRR